MGLVPEPPAQVYAPPIKTVPNREINRKTVVEVELQANFIALQITF